MKKMLKFPGVIVLTALIGFLLAACDLFDTNSEPDPDDNSITIIEKITVAVEGDFSDYSGWKANIAFTDVGTTNTKAYTMPVNVSSATSLKFVMLDYVTDAPFETAGSYDLILWFKKDGQPDKNYVLENRAITENANTIQFTGFTLVSNTGSDDDDDDGDDYSDLYGRWIKDNFYEDARLTLVISEGYFGFVSESLMGGGGTSYSFDIISYEGTTMTLDDYDEPFTVYINSDGKIFISGFESHDGTYTNEDDYIYEGFTPPDTATDMIEDRWYRGSFSNLDEAPQWFTFDAEAGETYKIYINDTDWIEDFYLTDVVMNIFFNGKKLNYGNVDLIPYGDNSFFEFDADEDGTVYVEVIQYGYESWGNFDVGYNSAGGRGDLIWQLSESFWIFGNFDYANRIYYVIEAQAGTTYSIWLDDFDNTESKIDVKMSVGFYTYNIGDKGTVLEEERDISKYEYTPTVKCMILIMITPFDSDKKDGDNFEIVFTTDGKNPGKG